jgi:hypothetical protein
LIAHLGRTRIELEVFVMRIDTLHATLLAGDDGSGPNWPAIDDKGGRFRECSSGGKHFHENLLS